MMENKVLVCFFSVFVLTFLSETQGFLSETQGVTKQEITLITKEINSLIASKKESLRNGVTYLPYIANFVRLAFHDCIGGCDGCVDLKHTDNKGLEASVAGLNKLFTKGGTVNGKSISTVLGGSRGDLYALAAIVAVNRAAANQPCRPRFCNAPKPTLAFRYGRPAVKDCSAVTERKFPNPNSGYAKTTGYFKEQFGFSPREVAALMGAHSLGRALGTNSGFRGPWVKRISTLNNDYYRDLLDDTRKWAQTDIRSRFAQRTQWNWNGQSGNPMMLNSDMCLVKNIKPTDAVGHSSCSFSSCSASPTAQHMKAFAADNSLWMKEFSVVFQKMIEHGAKNLKRAQ